MNLNPYEQALSKKLWYFIKYMIMICANRKITFSFFVAAFIVSMHSVLAQNLNVLNAPVPPSPAAYAITKVTDLPVSYYTGTADISIPLFQLSGTDLQLPINLVYNANGFKVNEIPGWVGYGWTLSSSGAISRTIQDAPDNFANGYYRDAMDNYYTASGKPKLNECAGVLGLNTTQYLFYKFLNTGTTGQPTFYDTEPDVYSYALPTGTSGKFVIDRNGKVRALPKTRTKIEMYATGGGIDDFEFSVTDESGDIYSFSAFERIQSMTVSSNYMMNGVSRLGDMQPKNSWYISQIRSGSAREIIAFAYVPETTSYRTPDHESKGFLVVPPNVSDPVGPDYANTDYTNYSTNTVSGQRLSSITFRGYTVNFIAENTDRLDLTGGHRLKQLVVLHNADTIKNYKFFHSYFTSFGGNPEYLRLDSLVEFGKGGVRMPAHKFSYYDALTKPTKNSYSIDHWGYFNGANNSTLLPRYFKPNLNWWYNYDYFINFKGANRNPAFDYTQYGMLQQIKYPTGGAVKVEYEPNTYSRFGTEYEQIENSRAVFINPTQSGNTQEGLFYVDDDFFTLTQDTTYLWVDAISTCEDPGGGLPADCGIIITGTNVSYGQQLINGSTTAVYRLFPGSYRLRATISIYRTDVIGATIKWYTKGSQLVNKTGPGLRVKSIQQFENPSGTATTVRKFKYELSPGVSSGILHDILRYDYDYKGVNNSVGGTIPTCENNYYEYRLRVLESGSLNSFVNQTTQLGYDKVEEIVVSSPSDTQTPVGRTIYEFYNEFNNWGFISPIEGSLNLPITVYPGLTGKAKNQKVYRQDDVLLSAVDYTYTISPIDSIVGWQAAPAKFENCGYCNFAFRQYWFLSYAVESATSVTNTYQPGGATLTESKTMNYVFRNGLVNRDSYYIMRKMDTQKSDGYSLSQELKYAFDFTDPVGSTVLADMLSRNKLEPVLSLTRNTKDGNVLQGRLLNYEVDNFDASIRMKRYYDIEEPAPLSYATATTIANINSPPTVYKLKATYQYDNSGNLSAIQKTDDLTQSFLWSGTVTPAVIAEVINASPNQFYFDGFENGGGTIDAQARTGGYSRASNFTFVPPSGLTVVSGSKLTYWFWNGSAWTYKELAYSGGSVLIQDGTKIDDLYIIPPGAQMTSYTYKYGVGVTSVSDKTQTFKRYEYDSFNRLKLIRDQNGNIEKSFVYNFRK